jgi:hypothetical protein
MKDLALKFLTGLIVGIGWAIAMALIGFVAKGCYYAISFGWNLI